MGDRTTVEMIIKKKDRELVLDKFGLQEFYDELVLEGKDDLLEVIMIDVNYAGWTELEELCQHMDFVGRHEAGATYGAFVFSSVGSTELLGLETGHEGGFVVHFHKKSGGELAFNMPEIQEYSRQYKLFTGEEPF